MNNDKYARIITTKYLGERHFAMSIRTFNGTRAFLRSRTQEAVKRPVVFVTRDGEYYWFKYVQRILEVGPWIPKVAYSNNVDLSKYMIDAYQVVVEGSEPTRMSFNLSMWK